MQKGFALTILLAFLAAVSLGVLGYYLYKQQTIKNINSFEECARFFPVMESYPAQCNTSDGKHFVQELSDEEKVNLDPRNLPLIKPQSADQLTWKSYKDSDLELIYPDFFDIIKSEADISRAKPNNFSNSKRVKFIAFFAPQSDHGFTLELWSNPNNLTVTDWWKEQFSSTKENSIYGINLKEIDLNTKPERVASYDVYEYKGYGGYKLFNYKNYIALFSSSMFQDRNIKVLESLK